MRFDVEDVARELAYFQPNVVRLVPPAPREAASRAEEWLGVHFPPTFRRFLAWHNGGWVGEDGILGIPPVEQNLDLIDRTTDLRRIRGADWPTPYVTVADDGCGNPFVLVTDKCDQRGESPVVFVNGISLEVEAVAGSTYLAFLWFFVHDLTVTTGPDGQAKSMEEFDYHSYRSWKFNLDLLLRHDPDAERWFSVFGIDPSRW